jgi:hypothetical protein
MFVFRLIERSRKSIERLGDCVIHGGKFADIKTSDVCFKTKSANYRQILVARNNFLV